MVAPVGIGDRVGRLTIVSVGPTIVESDPLRTRSKTYRPQWVVRCDCGTEKTVRRDSVRRGFSLSCGCLQTEASVRHGHWVGYKASPTYKSWDAMHGRCTNPAHARYSDYGGRGITVCDRWYKFENFLADMGERPDGTSIDRINNDGNYEPSNCRWATPKEQAANRRNSRRVVRLVA